MADMMRKVEIEMLRMKQNKSYVWWINGLTLDKEERKLFALHMVQDAKYD